MKKSYQHIIKKSYTTPKIEEVEIDVAISLDQPTTGGECIGCPELPPEDEPENQAINYGTQNYQSPTSPFGDTPQY